MNFEGESLNMGGKVGLNIRSGIKAVDGTSLSPDSHAGKVGLSIGGRISGDFGYSRSVNIAYITNILE